MPLNIYQGDKVGISAAGQLKRRNFNLATNDFPDGMNLMSKIRTMVKYFEVNHNNRQNMIKFYKTIDVFQQMHSRGM